MTKIAFIGAGNMNGAIILGLLNSGINPENIMVTNPSPEKRKAFSDKYGIKESANNNEAVEFADMIVLGVKPHFISDVCQEFSTLTRQGKCFISVAAGTPIAQIQTALGGNTAVIRTMPNTPSQLGLGITGAFASSEVSEEQKAIADQLLKAVGDVVWLDNEAQMNNITAISGSGPAYYFLFMEAMEKMAKEYGFSAEQSRLLVQQTALGAATMVAKNDISISQLRENVTSKGGTTQAALNAFTNGGLIELVETSMNAALSRAEEMAK